MTLRDVSEEIDKQYQVLINKTLEQFQTTLTITTREHDVLARSSVPSSREQAKQELLEFLARIEAADSQAMQDLLASLEEPDKKKARTILKRSLRIDRLRLSQLNDTLREARNEYLKTSHVDPILHSTPVLDAIQTALNQAQILIETL